MTAFSQPERRRLERMQISGQGVDPHPDSDLLAAFAEQALTTREREQVLSHVSKCADCREVLALANLPMVEAVPEPVRKRGIWEWSAFHWGAAAATAVVVTVAVFLGTHDVGMQKASNLNPMTSETAPLHAPEPPASSNEERAGTVPQNAPAEASAKGRHLQEQIRIEKPRADEAQLGYLN